MIAVAELELHDIANGGDNGVRDESVLRTTNNYRNDLVGAAVGLDCVMISERISRVTFDTNLVEAP